MLSACLHLKVQTKRLKHCPALGFDRREVGKLNLILSRISTHMQWSAEFELVTNFKFILGKVGESNPPLVHSLCNKTYKLDHLVQGKLHE